MKCSASFELSRIAAAILDGSDSDSNIEASRSRSRMMQSAVYLIIPQTSTSASGPTLANLLISSLLFQFMVVSLFFGFANVV